MRVEKVNGQIVTLSGKHNLSVGQIVKVVAVDSVTQAQRGFYWGVLLDHLSKLLDIPKQTLHDKLRFAVGFTRFAILPDGRAIEYPKSTKDSKSNKKEFSEYLDLVWLELNKNGIQYDYENWIDPVDLELDRLIQEYEEILELRRQNVKELHPKDDRNGKNPID